MTLEAGEDQSYFPSAKVRLVMRFEEYGTPALKGKAPTKTTPRLKGVKDERAPLRVVEDGSTPGITKFVLTSGVASSPGVGTDQQKSSDGLTHEVSGIIPARASWKLNDTRTADTLSLAIRWIDMPIDPRVIRACAVDYFLGTVPAQDFAQGVLGVTRPNARETTTSREPLNLVPDSYVDGQGRQRTNLRFRGWVDKYKVTLGSDEPIITLDCVDNTRLLEKQPRPPRLNLGMEKPIDEAVAEYLSHFPQMEGLEVVYLPAGARTDTVPPRLKNVLSGTAHMPNLGPPPSKGGGAVGGEQQSVWDYLNIVVRSVAHTIRIDGVQLIIQRLSNLMGTGPTPRAEDPYQGRDLSSGRYPVRAFIYGRNVAELDVDREFTRKAPKNIECRAYDPERKNVIVARFPEKGDRVTDSGPGDGKADQPWTVVHGPPGIRDKVTLKQVAEEVYNNQGRQELAVRVKTRNLASFGGDNGDPDLLDMKVGDAFEILVNRGQDQGTLSEVERQLSAAELNKQLLGDLGYGREFAEAYASAYTDAGFQREYKLREMSVDWDHEEGVTFELMGVNYIVARVDRATSAGTER